MFDAASRYLLFPLKRAVADVLLPHLEMAPPAELCHWLMLADMYDVLNLCPLKSFLLDSSFWCFLLFTVSIRFLMISVLNGNLSLYTCFP